MSRDRFTIKGPLGENLLFADENLKKRVYDKPKIEGVFLIGPAIDRLAEYEDLIFSPDTLNAIIKEWKEWADAKNDGRLVFLPCKVGDTVYQINPPCVAPPLHCPYEGGYGTYRCANGEHGDLCKAYVSTTRFGLSLMDGFGRIYFKTEEEAEAALKERYGK